MSATLSGFLRSLDGAVVPRAVTEAIARHTLDIFAGLFAGADLPEMQPVLAAYSRSHAAATPAPEAGQIAIPATSLRSQPALAAGAAAALSHAAEFDPIHAATVICPAAVTIPAALAIAQITKISGPRYVAAVCAGYEAAIRLGRALDTPALLARGWWPTAVCGSFAAAAAAAICLGLDDTQFSDALGLAAVLSGGLSVGGASAPVARNLLCAHVVRTGVEAALAARDGATGPHDLFSGPRNFLSAFGRDGAAVDMTPTGHWAVLETSLKRWPCALQAQSALDALAQVSALATSRPDASRREYAAGLTAVDVRLPAAMCRIVDRPEPPATQWGAAASVQFLAAALLLDGDILDARLAGPGRSDPRVLQLMQKVRVSADPELDKRYPREWPARVTVLGAAWQLNAGPALTAESAQPPGHPSRPLPFDISANRFRRYAATRLSVREQDAALAFIEALPAHDDVGAGVATLIPQAASHDS